MIGDPGLIVGLALLGAGAGAAVLFVTLRWKPSWAEPGAASITLTTRALGLILAGALLGAWSGAAFESAVSAAVSASFAWVLLLIAALDAEHLWLPRVLTLPLGLSGLLQAALLAPAALTERAVGAVVGFAALAAVAFLYRRLRSRHGLGGGDKWLLGAVGAWVGWAGLPTVVLWACALGLSLAGARALTRRGASWGDEAPLGTYLAVGAWLTWLYGPLGLA